MTMYGYARVSSDGQCLDAQQEALAAAGAAKVFAEKLSGASAANRTDLAKLLAKLGPGDVLLEHFPGRSNREGFPKRRESDSRFPLGQGGQL